MSVFIICAAFRGAAQAGIQAAVRGRQQARSKRGQMMERLAQLNLANPPVKTAEQFAETVRSDLKAWRDIVRESNLKAD